MRKSFVQRILFSMTIITNMNSCIKEKEIGCSDPIAVNYDPDATSIPGSDIGHCIYDSSCLTLIQNVDINNYSNVEQTQHNLNNFELKYSGYSLKKMFEIFSGFFSLEVFFRKSST